MIPISFFRNHDPSEVEMRVVPIKTRRDYKRTLAEIEGLMGAKRGTPDGDRLDVLVRLVEAWEARHFPLDLSD